MDKVLDIRKLRCVAAAIFLVWIVAQCIVVIHYWGVPQYSDAGNYQRLAFQCYSEGTWCPTVAQLNSEPYVINPGYVNYLIIVLNVFGTLDIVPLFNIVFNAALALTVFLIIRHLAGEVCAHAGVIMYCLIWSNTIIVATTMSELLFGLLVYVSIALVRDRWPALLASGALVAAANYVRPVAVLFVVPVVAYMFICRFGRRSMISYATGLALVLSSLCLFNYRVNGHAIVAASTSGINMLIGASDQANGSFECTVFDEGNAGYIPNETGLDVFGKDSVWLKKAERWVSEHPADYIALMPEKVFRLWCSDDYSDMSLIPKNELYADCNRTEMIVRILSRSLVYYIVLVLSAFGLFAYGRRLWGVAGLPLIPLIGGCCIHALMYGAVRYHYPYMPILIFYASVGLIFLVGKIRKKKICLAIL